jgi:Icc protein
MTKFAWASDIHLDTCQGGEEQIVKFAESLIARSPAGIFLTGDISLAQRLVYHLSILERVAQIPIYFVLGNHDYYGGDVAGVRSTMKDLSNISQYLKYMQTMPYIALSPTTALIGHDGWYDAFNGDWQGSNFMMTDWYAIHDFVPHSGGLPGMQSKMGFNRGSIVGQARKLAHEGVTHMHAGIKSATRYYKNIIILTHFPPFAESHVFNGKIGDPNAQPWYTSKMCGDMLLDAAKAYPHVNFTVLCGHTHGKSDKSYAPNLRVHVAAAEYGSPCLQEYIEIA